MRSFQNPCPDSGVYYEVGYALGCQKEVVQCCPVAELDAGRAHFDIRHINLISYDSHDDLREKLTARILNRLDQGPYTPANV